MLRLRTLTVLALWSCGALAAADNDVGDNEIVEAKYGSDSLQSPASPLADEVDILKLVNVSSKAAGVSLTEGPIKGFPAYKLRLQYGEALVSNSSPVTNAIRSRDGFTVVFVYRQQRRTLGTLLSLNSPGRLTPWFQLTSNMRTGHVQVHYRLSPTGRLHQASWPLPGHHRKSWPLAAWTWLSVSADYNSSTLRLDVDCLPSRFEQLATARGPAGEHRVSVPSDALVYFRQEPGRKKKFLGSMQVAKVLPHVTHHRLWTCSDIRENNSPENKKPVL